MLDHDEALDDAKADPNSEKLKKVHARALRRFDDTVIPQIPVRELALLARRFASIPGAQWDGEWGEQFEQSIKVEINKVSRSVRKIENDYRQNRIIPDFRPDGGDSDQDSADTLDGLHRADSYKFKAQQARDNAFHEAVQGGMGAYRLTNQWADPYDKESDSQRINPGMLIADADQSVFFDGNSKLYDKSDARFAFVLTALTRDAFEEAYGDNRITSWPEGLTKPQWDWYRPDSIAIAEYYEVEDREETVAVFTHAVTSEERRFWVGDLDADEARDMVASGWNRRNRKAKRKRVHKYVMSGAEVLKDQGEIAGCNIPIVPVFGNREWIDGIERFTGHVQDKMDAQRLYNSNVSKLAETNALAPREVPIFAAEQMPPNLAALWARQNIDRHPYALVNPLLDGQGNIVSAGPIGKIDPPTLSPVTAALLDISNRDLTEDDQDGADQVKANVSAEAMDIAATRVDDRSGIYLDNMRQSVQREGEIYLGMAVEVYAEPGRKVETMTEDGDDGEETLHKQIADGDTHRIVNDFGTGKYKVIADVTEATATRREKTVKSALHIAEVAMKAGNNQLANAALITAVTNIEGEGMGDLKKFGRRLGLEIKLVEPNEDEKQEMAEAQQNAQPDPGQALVEAQTAEIAARADLNKAKTLEAGASAHLKAAQADAVGGPEAAPDAPTGLKAANDIADIRAKFAGATLKEAQAEHLGHDLTLQRIKTGHQILMEHRQQDHAEKTAGNKAA